MVLVVLEITAVPAHPPVCTARLRLRAILPGGRTQGLSG